MSYLELTDVQKRFGETSAVEDFNLAAEKGEFVSFLGPSGCGKTTTLRMIAGFEQPTSGTITIDGEDITCMPPNRRNVGMVFQSYALFPNMTVADNIGFGLKVRKRPADQIKKRVAELLEIVNLPDKGGRYPYQLSGGQQQRVALARALAFEPQVLLLDEPLSALDAKIRVALRHEIRSIQRQLGITTVYVTHDQEEALSLSDRVVVMSEGRMEQVGTPFEIYNFPSTAFVASFVGHAQRAARHASSTPARGELTVSGQPVHVSRRASRAPRARRSGVALRPEMVSLADRPDRVQPPDRQGHRRELPRLDRPDPRRHSRARRGADQPGPDPRRVQRADAQAPEPRRHASTVSFPLDGPLVLDAKAPVESVEALIAEA